MCFVLHQLFWSRSLLESSGEMVSEITEKMSKANNFLYLLVLAPNRDLVIHPTSPSLSSSLFVPKFSFLHYWELFIPPLDPGEKTNFSHS
jgi:hypothetical protein